MRVLIINGSPRIRKLSNTDKILSQFTLGMAEEGNTFEQYEISDRTKWDEIRTKYYQSETVLIALPLFVECIPGLLMEFLETVDPERQDNKQRKIGFILQSGFAEGAQLRCGETYLEMLASKLNAEYLGTLVKGDNFSIRLTEGADQEKITSPYREMGRIFGREGSFRSDECKKFTGPEEFPLPVRILLSLLFKTVVKKNFESAAAKWGCREPLDHRPYIG